MGLFIHMIYCRSQASPILKYRHIYIYAYINIKYANIQTHIFIISMYIQIYMYININIFVYVYTNKYTFIYIKFKNLYILYILFFPCWYTSLFSPTSPGEQTELNTRLFSVHRMWSFGAFFTSLLPVQGTSRPAFWRHGTPLHSSACLLVRPLHCRSSSVLSVIGFACILRNINLSHLLRMRGAGRRPHFWTLLRL